jgi:hypothetical protein
VSSCFFFLVDDDNTFFIEMGGTACISTNLCLTVRRPGVSRLKMTRCVHRGRTRQVRLRLSVSGWRYGLLALES